MFECCTTIPRDELQIVSIASQELRVPESSPEPLASFLIEPDIDHNIAEIAPAPQHFESAAAAAVPAVPPDLMAPPQEQVKFERDELASRHPEARGSTPTEPARHDPGLASSDVQQFKAVIRAAGSQNRLGAFCMPGKAQFVVHEIETGSPLDAWNEQHPQRAVRPGAVILSINGKSSMDEMKEEVADFTHMELKVQYRQSYAVTVRADGTQKLGLWVKEDTLAIDSIVPEDDYALSAWNNRCRPGYEIMPGDTVASVNGVSGSAREMQTAINARMGEVTLVLRRPVPTSASDPGFGG